MNTQMFLKIGRINYRIQAVDATKQEFKAFELVGPRGGVSIVIRNKVNPARLTAMFGMRSIKTVGLVENADGSYSVES